MSMLSKVKKLGNKLFSGVKVDKGASDDGSGSHNSGSHEQPGQSKNHSKLGPPLAPSSATDMASPSVAPSGKSFSSNPAPFLSAAKRAALMSMQVHTSTESLGIKSPARNDIVLPAVQIVPHALPSSHLHVSVPSSHLQLSMPSSRLQEAVPSSQLQMSTPSNVVQAQLQDTSHSSGPMCTLRRKSTPAELDMALHSAEGRSAIQQLLTNQQGNKPMAFAQYFGTSISSTATPSMPSPAEVPRPPLAQRVGKQTVPEEDVVDGGDDISSSAAALAGSAAALAGAAPVAGPKPSTPKGSAAHRPAPSASATAAAAAAAARAPSPKPALQPEDSEPALASVPVPSPRGVPAKVNYVPPEDGRVTPPAPRTKLLSLSPHLPAIMMRKNWSLSDYSIVRKMYTGYASTVYQATCRKSLEQVALKVYHMENLCELNHYQVYREIRVHSTLQHQNIIHLLASFQEGMDVVLVQEYAEGGDLYRLLHRNGGRLSERQAVEMVLHPFLLALHYLHTRGIMHRDVKPENVLFTEHRVLKLADFGLAIDLNEERAVTRAGTLDYMAPEVLRCPPKNLPQENKNNAYLHYTNSVDAWAVGVFAYELVVGFPPFAGESQLDSVEKIMHSTPEFPEKMTELAKSFICQALKKHPGDRPTVIEMLHHPWIRSYQRRTSMLHMPVPRTRRGSSVAYAEPGKLSPLPGTPPAEPSSPAPKAQPQPPPAAASAAAASAAPGHLRMAAAVAGGPSSGSLKPLPAAMPSSGSLRTALSTTSEASSQAPLFDGNPEDMTPEQIEEMIRKLMLAKQAAIDRTSNSKGSARSSGHAPVVPGS